MRSVKEIQADLGKAFSACRGFVALQEKQPDKAAEHQAALDKAYAEFSALKVEEQQAQAHEKMLADLKAESDRQSKPVNEITTLGETAAVDPRVKQLHRAAFADYIRSYKGSRRERAFYQKNAELMSLEQHMLIGTINDQGGFLVPDDFQNQVIMASPGFAVMRGAGVTVITTSSDRVKIPVLRPRSSPYPHMYTSGFVGSWKPAGTDGGSAAAPTVQNQPRFGQEEIPVADWRPDSIELERNLLEDSAVNVEDILARLIGQTKGLDEDYEFINGTGVGRPEGLMTAGVSTVASGSGSTVTYGGLVNLFMGLPAQYRQTAKWLLNSATFGKIIQLETTAGYLIFPPNALPGTMFGKPVLFSEFMPDIAASAKPIAFGDFSNYYVVDKGDLRITRLEERFAPNLGIMAHARVGGQLTLLDAFRFQVISA